MNSPTLRVLHRGDGFLAVDKPAGVTVIPGSGASAACRNSISVANRSPATLESARSIADRIDAGTPGRSVVIGGTGSSSCRDNTAITVGPVKGG